MKNLANILFYALLLLFSSACSRAVKVARVIDGDTIVVKPYEIVRIIGIDAPEVDTKSLKFTQDIAKYNTNAEEEKKASYEAKMALTALLLKKKVKLKSSEHFHLERLDHNRYARNLYFVEIGNEDVAEVLLSTGKVRVWNEDQFSKLYYSHEKDSLYQTMQESAKSSKIGLWGDKNLQESAEEKAE